MLLNLNLISGVRMKINKEKLIQLIAEKTELDNEEISGQLEKLIQRIVEAAQRGKALEIKEFGLFYFDDNGDLKFEPSLEFSTEINYKYAGMEPLELKPARDTISPEEPAEEPDKPTVDEEEPVNDFAPQTSDLDNDPFAGLLGDDRFSDEDENEEETVSEPVPLKTGKKKTSKKQSPGYKRTQKKNPIMAIIITILAFVLLAAGYFIFIEFFKSSPPQASIATTAAEPKGDMQAEELERVEPEKIIEVSETEPEPAEPPAETKPAYGLTGEISDKGNDGYSIVVYSFNREYQAREAAFELNREGDYRVLVTPRTIRGNRVWRVSLGQFPDIEQAQQKAKTLPEPHNSENFIQRIQIN